MSRHTYDRDLIKELCKKQPKGNFNATNVAKSYCRQKDITFSIYKARAVQQIIKDEGYHEKDSLKPFQTASYSDAVKRNLTKRSKIYFITWAQAHTPISEKLWESMKAYAKKIGAEIVVIPGTYLNYNSNHKKMVNTWDDRVIEHMYASETKIFKHLHMIPDADILPTASMPLTGMESVTGIESSIIGHPRQHMAIIPTMKNSRRKVMITTGSITVENYRRARVGKKAKTHHKMGFLVAEKIDNEDFVVRHVEAEKDGSFQDLIYRVEDGKVKKNAKWDALISGDTHLTWEDMAMIKEQERLAKKGKPDYIVWHDLLDGISINPHQMKDYVEQVVKAKKGLNSLQRELDYNKKFLEDRIAFAKKIEATNVIVPSNHPEWLDRWVRLSYGEKDAINATLYNQFRAILYEEKAPKGLYAYLIDEWFGDEVITLHRDDTFMVAGHECNSHGDLGANGAKGTPRTFKRLNTKIVSGDKHFPYTYDTAYGVGVTAVLDHRYNRGMSSWMQSSGIIHSNGTFQHLMFSGGKFTTLF